MHGDNITASLFPPLRGPRGIPVIDDPVARCYGVAMSLKSAMCFVSWGKMPQGIMNLHSILKVVDIKQNLQV